MKHLEYFDSHLSMFAINLSGSDVKEPALENRVFISKPRTLCQDFGVKTFEILESLILLYCLFPDIGIREGYGSEQVPLGTQKESHRNDDSFYFQTNANFDVGIQ